MSNLIKLFKRWKEVLLITLVIKILLLFISYLVFQQRDETFFELWVRWDGPHYIDIAKDGYVTEGKQALWIVFYPLYPLFIKLFSILLNNFYGSAIIVSTFFSFLASILLYELVLLDFKKRVATLSVWFLNIFPTAYFLSASYTESLFLSLSLATIYLYRKGNFFESGIFGAFSSLTRINGLTLIPLLLFEGKNTYKKLVTISITVFGFLIYLLLNYQLFNDPFYFMKPLVSNWYKHIALPTVGVKNLINSIPQFNEANFYIYISELTFLILIFLVGIYSFFKIRKSYGIYIFINLLLLTSTSFILSTPRYSLILFPIFITFALISKRIIFLILSTTSIILLIYFTTLYTQGQWAF